MGAHGYEVVGHFSGESGDFFCAVSEIDYRSDIFQAVLLDLFDFFREVILSLGLELIEQFFAVGSVFIC